MRKLFPILLTLGLILSSAAKAANQEFVFGKWMAHSSPRDPSGLLSETGSRSQAYRSPA